MKDQGLGKTEAQVEAVIQASEEMKLPERSNHLDEVNMGACVNRYVNHLIKDHPELISEHHFNSFTLTNLLRRQLKLNFNSPDRVKKIKEVDDTYQINKILHAKLLDQRQKDSDRLDRVINLLERDANFSPAIIHSLKSLTTPKQNAAELSFKHVMQI